MNLFTRFEEYFESGLLSRGSENLNWFALLLLVHPEFTLEILSEWPPFKTNTPLCCIVDLNSNLQGSDISLFNDSANWLDSLVVRVLPALLSISFVYLYIQLAFLILDYRLLRSLFLKLNLHVLD